MLKKICLIGFIAAAFSFAQEETYIRNICDTLPASATPNVELRMNKIVETQWFGSKDLSKKDSSSTKSHESYETLKPFRDKVDINMPYSITAGCAETSNNPYKFLAWNQTGKKWDLTEDQDGYATYIMDINMVEFAGYNASNSYNILAMKKAANLPEDGSYSAGELLVSKTFEFQFEWWLTYAAYKTESTSTNDKGQVITSIRWKTSSSIGMDSASSVKNAVNGLHTPDSVSKVQYQLFHVVLTDPNKKIVPFSSSSVPESSSSSEAKSSSSSEAESSSSVASSSSEQSSSSEVESSSSEHTTAIGRLVNAPRAFKAREIRRLDGSKIKAGEALVPGVYYVKGVDGRWKKQVELP